MRNIRRTVISASALFLILLLQSPLQAGWWVDSYRTDFTVKNDGVLTVSERIVANFTEEPHHGIYRDIPLKRDDNLGRKTSYRIKILFVDDGEGNSYLYTAKKSGGNLHIQIGDPDRMVQDVRPYRIVYELQRWCLNFPDRQELYWNAIGNQWAVPIREASATVELPEGIDAAKARTMAFTGVAGAKGADYSAGFEDGLWRFKVTRPFEPYEGLTLAVTWPGKPVPTPSFKQELLWTIQDNIVLLLPIVLFALLFFQWWKTGRDPKGREFITVMYHPPEGLTAAEAGTLIDERVDLSDITASLVELATRGYLIIREEEAKGFVFKKADYTLEKVDGKDWGVLLPHERYLLERLFEARDSASLADLDTTFYQYLPQIRKKIYASLVARKYFSRDPETVRNIYTGIGIAVAVIGIFGAVFIQGAMRGEPDMMTLLAVGLSSVLFFIFAPLMPSKTREGVLAREQLMGLQEYIQRAEKETLNLAEKQNVFEEILPFAMALGISSKWASVFSGIFREPPSWYRSHGVMTGWSAYHLQSHLNSACTSVGSSMTSTPRSSGGSGGFSGGGSSDGGGGGGGGGSW